MALANLKSFTSSKTFTKERKKATKRRCADTQKEDSFDTPREATERDDCRRTRRTRALEHAQSKRQWKPPGSPALCQKADLREKSGGTGVSKTLKTLRVEGKGERIGRRTVKGRALV